MLFLFLKKSKTPYKKQDETQKLFLEDLVLLMAKGFFPLSTCENVQMWKLALRLDPNMVFPFRKTLS
jgi:preprotein translocase subunit SecB